MSFSSSSTCLLSSREAAAVAVCVTLVFLLFLITAQHYIEKKEQLAVTSLQLAIHFLLNTYFKMKFQEISDQNQWLNLVSLILKRSPQA